MKAMKLIRDKIRPDSGKLDSVKVDSQFFKTMIRAKLLEEAGELASSFFKEEVIEEAADILEVISAICRAEGIDFLDVLDKRAEKAEERGRLLVFLRKMTEAL